MEGHKPWNFSRTSGRRVPSSRKLIEMTKANIIEFLFKKIFKSRILNIIAESSLRHLIEFFLKLAFQSKERDDVR